MKCKNKCYTAIAILTVIGYMFSISQINSEARAIQEISSKIKDTTAQLEADRQVSERINVILEAKQSELLILIQNGDISKLTEQANEIRAELVVITDSLAITQTRFEARQISDSEMKAELEATRNKLTELEAKYTVLETAIQTLDGSIDDKIKAQLGDIEKLKEDIKQQILNELNN